jgi:chromosome segregation ATPase
MKSSTQHLPNDTEKLQRLVLSLRENIDSLATKNVSLASDNEKLENRIDSLEDELRLHRIKRFKSQSEQAKHFFEASGFEQIDIFPETLAALLQELGLAPEEEAPTTIKVPAHSHKSRKSRALDASLPRVDVIHYPNNKSCDHCGDEMQCIGEEPPLE